MFDRFCELLPHQSNVVLLFKLLLILYYFRFCLCLCRKDQNVVLIFISQILSLIGPLGPLAALLVMGELKTEQELVVTIQFFARVLITNLKDATLNLVIQTQIRFQVQQQ